MSKVSSQHLIGRPFVGVFSSADASALSEPNSRFVLTMLGEYTAYTLKTTDVVCITDIVINSTGAVAVTLYDGANNTVGTGEQIVKADFAAKGTLVQQLLIPHGCQVGTWPKVITSGAGQVEATIHGVIA